MSIVDRTDLGIALGGLSDRQIKTLINKGMPVVTKADRNAGIAYEFDEQVCVDWYRYYETVKQQEARIKQLREDAAKEPDKDIKAAKLTKLNLENARLRLRLDQEQGDLVPVESIGKIIDTQLANVKSQLLALPHKLAPLLAAGGEVEDIDETIASYIHETLEELSTEAVLQGVDGD